MSKPSLLVSSRSFSRGFSGSPHGMIGSHPPKVSQWACALMCASRATQGCCSYQGTWGVQIAWGGVVGVLIFSPTNQHFFESILGYVIVSWRVVTLCLLVFVSLVCVGGGGLDCGKHCIASMLEILCHDVLP